MLTLSEAIKSGRLRDFIAQEEARGTPPANLREFEDLAANLIKGTPPKIKHRVPACPADVAQAVADLHDVRQTGIVIGKPGKELAN
jgi:hypothetical protein